MEAGRVVKAKKRGSFAAARGEAGSSGGPNPPKYTIWQPKSVNATATIRKDGSGKIADSRTQFCSVSKKRGRLRVACKLPAPGAWLIADQTVHLSS